MVREVLDLPVAVALALMANVLSVKWATSSNALSPWLFATIFVAPFVFLSFGVVASRRGVAVAAGTVDSALTVATIAVGLFGFREWHRLSGLQAVGIALAILGIMLMTAPKASAA